MNILGIHCGHNSSAALMIKGKMVGVFQEERFTKTKNQVSFPIQSIRELLKQFLNNDINQLDSISFFTKNVDPIGLAISRYSNYTVNDHIEENYRYWYPLFYENKKDNGDFWKKQFKEQKKLNKDQFINVNYMNSKLTISEMTRIVSDKIRLNVLRKDLNYKGHISIHDHHTCHAYYAFYGSKIPQYQWKKTLIVTADSWGDDKNWSIWFPEKNGKLTMLDSGSNNTISRIYRFVTLILGMKPNEHEYKVMGLSGYTKQNKYTLDIEKLFLSLLDFKSGKFVTKNPLKDSYFDLKNRLEGYRFDNISSALQSWSEKVTRKWIKFWLEKTNKTFVCFSGGLSMNIKSNGKLLDLKELNYLYVPASGGDESGSIGACYVEAKNFNIKVEALQHVYLGNMQIKKNTNIEREWKDGILKSNSNLNDFEFLNNIDDKKISKLLLNNFIIARCTGPMEFGARALGNRSILASPKNIENLKKINDAIKMRDFWMPFTPSIMEEYSDKYLLNPKKILSPFMTIGFKTKNIARKDIPAALHPGDYTARPQFVSKKTNFRYWNLINEFRMLSGIPALLNTSLNLHGEPMNFTVTDAARTLALSGLHCLILDNFGLLVKKKFSFRIKSIIEESN